VRAIVLRKTGSSDELRLEDVPEPSVGADDVLVRVRAAGVCGRDLIDRRGGFPMMKLPTVLGHEFAGEVLEVGALVRDFSPGDRVANLHRPWCGECRSCVVGETLDCENAWQSFGHTVDGAYAERVVAHHRALVKLPDDVDFVQAASLGCTAGVALRALRSVAGLELGERLLVTGASGGVGLAALQLGKMMGARVIATTSNAEKTSALRAAGADDVVEIAGGRFAERVRQVSDGGVEVALELTGAATFRDAEKSLRPRGRLVVLGNITLERVSVNLGRVILLGHRIAGSRSYSRRDLDDCLDWLRAGRLEMKIDRTLPLQEAKAAHDLLENRSVTGRVILLPT
jgi:acryloyl-coenzyme A reductase